MTKIKEPCWACQDSTKPGWHLLPSGKWIPCNACVGGLIEVDSEVIEREIQSRQNRRTPPDNEIQSFK